MAGLDWFRSDGRCASIRKQNSANARAVFHGVLPYQLRISGGSLDLSASDLAHFAFVGLGCLRSTVESPHLDEWHQQFEDNLLLHRAADFDHESFGLALPSRGFGSVAVPPTVVEAPLGDRGAFAPTEVLFVGWRSLLATLRFTVTLTAALRSEAYRRQMGRAEVGAGALRVTKDRDGHCVAGADCEDLDDFGSL